MNIKRILGRAEASFEKISMASTTGKRFPGYKLLVENRAFEIYKCALFKPQIVGAYKYVVATKSEMFGKQVISICPDYRMPYFKYRIPFNSKHFPDLLPGSKIMNCFVLPYHRETEKDKLYKRWRLVVVTDKCQVYHNFPARSEQYEGYEIVGDIKRFQESAVWDVPGRKYPTKEFADADSVEEFNPSLPDECYEYHPAINRSQYGNNGFDKFTYVIKDGVETKVSRFYFPLRREESNPFYYMGGFEPDYKMSLFGTYRANKDYGVRTVVFATSDGGRNFYAKYEFSDEGQYDFKQGADTWGLNHGNPMNGEHFEREFRGNAQLIRRVLVHDREDAKFGWETMADVEYMLPTNPITVVTAGSHHLSTGNIIAISASGLDSKWKWLFNNTFSPNSCGNGRLFKVEVVDSTTVKLFEYVASLDNNIACRHIHHINRVRDGWILGTGEIYPNGWLFFIQMKAADTFTRFSARDELTFIRLNASSKSVQRTVGADLIDGDEQRLIIASDHDTLPRPLITGAKYPIFSRNSCGIYEGLLKDIDDFDNFRVIYEAKEPAYFFKKLNNTYIFSGQRGEIAVGLNGGEQWVSAAIDDPFIHYYGSTLAFHVIDQYIIRIK